VTRRLGPRAQASRRGRSSVVERQLPKLNVVGSIPIARSNFLACRSDLYRSLPVRPLAYCELPRYPNVRDRAIASTSFSSSVVGVASQINVAKIKWMPFEIHQS
jgi:hypothetical protein